MLEEETVIFPFLNLELLPKKIREHASIDITKPAQDEDNAAYSMTRGCFNAVSSKWNRCGFLSSIPILSLSLNTPVVMYSTYIPRVNFIASKRLTRQIDPPIP